MNSVVIEKTNAICLQIRAWSNTSHIVTWLTDGFGKIVTPVKGAVRPKSLHLGQYDIAYNCELLFYRRERAGFHAIREATPLKLRLSLHDNWRSALAADYICALIASIGFSREESSKIFKLTEATLSKLETEGADDPIAVVLWFETKLLSICGLSPDWRLCKRCIKEHPGMQWFRFSVASGKFICSHTPEITVDSADRIVSVNESVYKLYRSFSLAHSPPRRPQKNEGNSFLGFCRFLGIFIQYHLDITPAARRVLVEMLFASKETN